MNIKHLTSARDQIINFKSLLKAACQQIHIEVTGFHHYLDSHNYLHSNLCHLDQPENE